MSNLHRFVTLLVAVALLAAACSSDDTSDDTTTTLDPPPTTFTPATTTTVAATTSVAETTTTSTSTTTTTMAGPPAPVSFSDIEPTAMYWGLYAYAAEDLSTPGAWVAFVNTGNYLGLAGVSPAESYYSFGEIGCDLPAADVLGVDPDLLTISMYFETEADASAALAAFPGVDPPVGIAEVELFCAD